MSTAKPSWREAEWGRCDGGQWLLRSQRGWLFGAISVENEGTFCWRAENGRCEILKSGRSEPTLAAAKAAVAKVLEESEAS